MLISIYRSRANLYSISRCSKVLIAGFVDFKDEEIDEFVVCEEFMESFVWFRGIIDIIGTVVDEEISLEKGELLLLLFVTIVVVELTGNWDRLVGRLRIRIGLLDFIKSIFEEFRLSSSLTVDDIEDGIDC